MLGEEQMKYTSRADLLIAAGESIKMQEKAGIEPRFKYQGEIRYPHNQSFMENEHSYEFPLSVVEGKPAFVGDVLYDEQGRRWIADDENFATGVDKTLWYGYNKMSWNPPKPKTVMVELLREDAERLANCAPCEAMKAIKKALEAK
jgi:hypothetical protein